MSILPKINSPKDLKMLNDNELNILSNEIREFLIENVSQTGGHLASNLGVVELTIALHKVFESPTDKIVWDVGHQSYVHKILTGRKELFGSLRKFGGLSGFPKTCESEHDIFNTGHSSTSISAALGIAKARDIKGEKFKTIAVIGDGALTGGMAFEALNDLGHSKNDMIVILNDNEMSISKNVGGLSKYLTQIRTVPIYYRVKKDINNILNKIPAIGESVAKTFERAKGSIKYLIMPGAIFEDLGLTYIGPIDGHNIAELNTVLSRTKELSGPVLVHVITKKGKGYKFAEEQPNKFHGVGVFNRETGLVAKSDSTNFSNQFGESLCKIAKDDDKVIAITAAMTEGTGLVNFSKQFPNRFFDVGIAEQHAVTLAAGFAIEGLKPVVAIYSTFLQRAYDQIIHDVALQNLPVIFAIDRAGIVGNDGETHHGVFDLSFLSHIPNMVIMAPRNYYEQNYMLQMALKSNNSSVAIRYPRGGEWQLQEIKETPVEFGKAEVMLDGDEIAIIGVGSMSKTAYKVASNLRETGISAGAINPRFIKPFDQEIILDCVENNKKIIIIEDNVRIGGYGSLVLDFLNSKKITNADVKIFAYDDQFITHGNVDQLYEKYGMDEKSILKEIYKTIKVRV